MLFKWRPKLVGPPPLCACGCGRSVAQWDGRRVAPKFIKNHHRRKWLSRGFTKEDARAFERYARVYKLTPEKYLEMVRQQGDRCAVCRTADKGTFNGRPRRFWCADHDHETGVVRGLLCFKCNVGIGSLGDNLERLEEAVAYLRRAQQGAAQCA